MEISTCEAYKMWYFIPSCLRYLQKNEKSLFSYLPNEIVQIIIEYSIPKINTIMYDGGNKIKQLYFQIDIFNSCMICGTWLDKCLITGGINCGCEPASLCQNCIYHFFKYS